MSQDHQENTRLCFVPTQVCYLSFLYQKAILFLYLSIWMFRSIFASVLSLSPPDNNFQSLSIHFEPLFFFFLFLSHPLAILQYGLHLQPSQSYLCVGGYNAMKEYLPQFNQLQLLISTLFSFTYEHQMKHNQISYLLSSFMMGFAKESSA